jgi:hypothetical protein
MTTQPSDWAVARAWRAATETRMTPDGIEYVTAVGVEHINRLARELDASGGGVEPVAWQLRSRFWDGAPWSPWQSFNSAEERDADWFPYIGSEWQCETRELYATPRAAEAEDGSLRVIAKRNLQRLIEIGSTDKATMLSCLEELS